jgi:hypothetical protein
MKHYELADTERAPRQASIAERSKRCLSNSSLSVSRSRTGRNLRGMGAGDADEAGLTGGLLGAAGEIAAGD